MMSKNCFWVCDLINLAEATNITLQLLNKVFESGELKGCMITLLSGIDVQSGEIPVKHNKQLTWLRNEVSLMRG